MILFSVAKQFTAAEKCGCNIEQYTAHDALFPHPSQHIIHDRINRDLLTY